MSNRYLVKFFYDQDHYMTMPVKAKNPEEVSRKIISLYSKENSWFSYPARDKYSGNSASECVIINLENVIFFKVENPTRVQLEIFSDDDYIDLNDSTFSSTKD